jgi:hypothetical protein
MLDTCTINTSELSKYLVRSVLPDKVALFLYEYHDSSFTSLHLSPLALDRSDIDVIT